MDFSDFWKASIDRPRDVPQVLDYAEKLTAPGGAMARLIDMGQVAVVGHSYGGYTALAAAGARYDLNAYNARCAAIGSNDPNYPWLCAPLLQHEQDMAKRAGLDSMPEGLWPSWGDSRVKAIIPMAGDSYLFDRAGLAQITIPMLAMGGTMDTGTAFDWGAKPAFENASSSRKALVGIEYADHMIFGPTCENIPYIEKLADWYAFYCLDAVWDKERALDLIYHLSTAFLLAELQGDKAAAEILAPDKVQYPGILYEATGF